MAGVRVDGRWRVTASALGREETADVVLRTEGDTVGGEVRVGGAAYPISGGTLDGDELSFRMAITEPMKATVSARVTVDGDRMSGSGKVNPLVRVKIAGERVSAE